MTPLLDAQRAMLDAQEAFNTMRAYMGNPQYKTVVAWLEALTAQHQVAMLTAGREKLPDMQVRLKQLMALRSALIDPGGAFTGFTFD